MGIKKSWTLTEKAKLFNNFEKSRMSKSEFSKEHFIPRTTLKTSWPTKKAIFSTDKTNCKFDAHIKF